MLVDDGILLEVHEHFARNIITGFARVGGVVTGIVAIISTDAVFAVVTNVLGI